MIPSARIWNRQFQLILSPIRDWNEAQLIEAEKDKSSN